MVPQIPTKEAKRKLSTNFRVRRSNGSFDEENKSRFKEQLNMLNPNAWFEVKLKEVGGGYERPTRYKYYFSALLPSIFDEVRKRYLINDEHPNTVEELHECLKSEFNCVYIINTETGEQRTTTQSTTNLSDRDFIKFFQESILEMSINQYFCEPKFYDDWKKEMKLKYEGK